jgi:hypothetical protein
LSGPIVVNGKKFNSHASPWDSAHQEVTDVMNYTANSWSNNKKRVLALVK